MCDLLLAVIAALCADLKIRWVFPDKVTHIFSKVKIFAVTNITVSFAVNILQGIDMSLRTEIFIFLDVIEGANHNRVTGNSNFFLDFNTGSFQKNFGRNIVSSK